MAVRLALAGAGVVVLSAASGCLSLSADQCSTSTDCGTGFVCSSNQICVRPASALAGGPVIIAGEGSGCTTTEACTTANGGRPSLCRKQGDPCVNLVTDACPKLYTASNTPDSWKEPNALFVGSISQARTADLAGTVFGEAQEAAMSLGIDEFMSPQGGQGVPGPNSTRRPLVGLYCQVEQLNPEPQRIQDSNAVVAHLKDNVGVSGIMLQDEHILYPAKSAVMGKVFTMCSYCQTEIATQDPDKFTWRAMATYKSGGAVWDAVTQDFEKRIRQNPAYGVGPTAPIRVAVTTSPSEYIDGLADIAKDAVHFNGGKSWADNLPYVKRVEMENWVKPGMSASVFAAAQELVQFKPHIILVGDDIESNRLLMPLVEAMWTGSQPRPYYIMSTAAFSVDSTNLVSTNENLRKRLVILTGSMDPAVTNNFVDFVTHIKSKLTPALSDRIETWITIAVPYDAFYSLGYALAAAPGMKPGPGDIKNAFNRLSWSNTQTVHVDIGPKTLYVALTQINAGTNISLSGTYTKLRWDANNAVIDGPTGAYCVDRDPSTGNAYLSGEAAPSQAKAGDPVTGNITCF